MTRRLTSTYTDMLDTAMYDGPVQAREKRTLNRVNLSNSISIDKSRTTSLVLLMLVLLQMATPMPSFGATYSVDQLRVYAHSRVVSFNEFICLDQILMQESHYNYLAVNSSGHYGIGQMHSKYYQSKDPYTQIDMTIKYIHTRYKTMCDALTFHRKHGYY